MKENNKTTQEQTELFVIKSAISELPEEQRYEVGNHAKKYRRILKTGGMSAIIALGLVAAEISQEINHE